MNTPSPGLGVGELPQHVQAARLTALVAVHLRLKDALRIEHGVRVKCAGLCIVPKIRSLEYCLRNLKRERGIESVTFYVVGVNKCIIKTMQYG